MRTRYTPEQRSEALELYIEHGPKVASDHTGIPEGTIASWAHRDGVQTRCVGRTAAAIAQSRMRWAERRLEMANRIGDAAELALTQTETALEGGDRKAKDFALTMAVLIDKAQLLSGDATARHAMQADTREEVLNDARDRALSLVPRAG